MNVNSTTFERIADLLDRIGNGKQAELRRGQLGEAFWRTLSYAGLETKEDPVPDKQVPLWQLLIQLVETTGHADVPLGTALRRADVADRRVDRMLDANRDRLMDQLPRLASQLAAAGQPVDWTDAYFLLLDSDPARVRVSRDYYVPEGDETTES